MRGSRPCPIGEGKAGGYTTAMRRGACAFAIACLSVALLSARSTSGSPDIQITLTAAAEPHRERVAAAVQEALARYVEWLGPLPTGALRIVDRPWRGPAPVRPSEVSIHIPWWPAAASMDVESEVAFGLARQWWPGLLGRADTATMANGAAWFLQGRVVERLFDLRFLSIAHSADSVRFFGGFVPWSFRPLAVGRPAVLRRDARPDRHGSSGLRLPAGLDPASLRAALAFGTLERYLTWPVLQGAMHAWARRSAEGPMSRSDIAATIGAAAGQDLSWFFATAFDAGARFDYALDGFSTDVVAEGCGGAPCFRSIATVIRRGEAQFTGASALPVGPYESGKGMEVRVSLADGQEVSARWDGRQASKAFQFEGPSPGAAASLDPDRVLLLDANTLDDRRELHGSTNVPVTKWVARWVVWLQDAMLTYASLL